MRMLLLRFSLSLQATIQEVGEVCGLVDKAGLPLAFRNLFIEGAGQG